MYNANKLTEVCIDSIVNSKLNITENCIPKNLLFIIEEKKKHKELFNFIDKFFDNPEEYENYDTEQHIAYSKHVIKSLVVANKKSELQEIKKKIQDCLKSDDMTFGEIQNCRWDCVMLIRADAEYIFYDCPDKKYFIEYIFGDVDRFTFQR